MKTTINFRGIYQRVYEGGYMLNSIIGFMKYPHLMTKDRVIQYRYKLVIDLWIFQIKFDWLYPKQRGVK